ncbi:MAG: hypothetical protein AAFY84_10350 [Pseudomonadota bacterium]
MKKARSGGASWLMTLEEYTSDPVLAETFLQFELQNFEISPGNSEAAASQLPHQRSAP